MNITYVTQYEIPSTNYIADFYLEDKQTVIEINGPPHYIKKFEGDSLIVTDELNGRSKLKDERLKALGLKTIHLRFELFDRDGDDLKVLAELIKSKL